MTSVRLILIKTSPLIIFMVGNFDQDVTWHLTMHAINQSIYLSIQIAVHDDIKASLIFQKADKQLKREERNRCQQQCTSGSVTIPMSKRWSNLTAG